MLPADLIRSDNKLSFAELARREGVSSAAVYRWHRSDPPLPAVKHGRRFVTSVEALDWWMGERARRNYERAATTTARRDDAPTYAAIAAECERAGI